MSDYELAGFTEEEADALNRAGIPPYEASMIFKGNIINFDDVVDAIDALDTRSRWQKIKDTIHDLRVSIAEFIYPDRDY